MTAVALAGAKGAPGVTTSALLLAAVWPVPPLLVEGDPAGGDLRCWLSDADGLPLRPDAGVVSLLSAHAVGGALADRSLLAHAQHLSGGLAVLVGPGNPAQSEALRGQWPLLAAALAAHHGDAIVDAGRTDGGDPTQLQLLRTADRVLVVAASTVASLAHSRDLLVSLSRQGIDAELLLVGSAADRDDAARALGASVHLLPRDPDAACALTGGRWGRRLDRSPLLAAGRRLAATLHEQLHETAPPSVFPAAIGAGADAEAAPGLALR